MSTPHRPDREKLGKLAWETYRKTIHAVTDDQREPDWSGLDHERQLAFRDAGEAVWKEAVRQHE